MTFVHNDKYIEMYKLKKYLWIDCSFVGIDVAMFERTK